MIAILYPEFYSESIIARYLDSFLNNLPENSPTIYLVTGGKCGVERRYKHVEFINLTIGDGRFGLMLWMFKVRKILEQLYIQKKIRAINLHSPSLILTLLLPRHIPLIFTAHSTCVGITGKFYKKAYFLSEYSWLKFKLNLVVEKIIFYKSKKIIALNAQINKELLVYKVNCPIKVISCGVDTSIFKPNDSLLKPYDVMFCGGLEHRQGSRAMIDVCKKLILSKPDIRILIIGYGNARTWVHDELAQYHQNVYMSGEVKFSERHIYYQQTKLFASTSYYEISLESCLEAMAIGLPVIVWDFLFYSDCVVEGQTGRLVEPDNFECMSKCIIELLISPNVFDSYMRNAKAHIDKHSQWKQLSEGVVEILSIE